MEDDGRLRAGAGRAYVFGGFAAEDCLAGFWALADADFVRCQELVCSVGDWGRGCETDYRGEEERQSGELHGVIDWTRDNL